MANYNGGAITICPYYSHEGEKTISCEGIIKNTYVMNRFVNPSAKEEWQKEICATYDYAQCPIASVNEARFDDYGKPVIEVRKCIKRTVTNVVTSKNQIKGQISLDDYLKNGGS